MSQRTPPTGAPFGGSTPSSGWFSRFLATVEWLGNKLPHPVTLFALLWLIVIVASAVGAAFGFSVTDPRPEGMSGRAADGMIRTVSLLSPEGVRFLCTKMVTNFTGFAPLGTVLVALLGVGVAERSGLFSAAVRALVLNAPRNLVTVVIVFAGILSNTASEMGYVVLIPLAAMVYHSLGRHPLAGLAAAFAGVSGGYSANLLIGTIDPLLSGISESAARLIDPRYTLHPAVNWYFMLASTFLVTVLGTWVSLKIVEPRLGAYDPSKGEPEAMKDAKGLESLTATERRGLAWAGVSCVAVCALVALTALPGAWAPWLPGLGVLREPGGG
ncbi:MAG TPA: aminobenzoyl-glutamate transporter, partial [Phycisphaerales bacterium]|nr:aminobenzoyl-glutamate transporter [Phycisphaerales bacterium]